MKNGSTNHRKNIYISIFLLGSLVMTVMWLSLAGDADKAASLYRRETKKLGEMTELVQANRALIDAGRENRTGGGELAGKPAISIIKDLAIHAGISEKLIRVIPEENRKRKEVTAKVVLKGVQLREIVSFLVRLRTEYPTVFDKEARLRLTGKGKDRWDAGLALSYGN